jgi:hypothetical protein
MSNLDRRIGRLEQALREIEIKDVALMTREEREQLMVEILSPYMGEETARAHVHRLRTDSAYAEEELRITKEVSEQAGIILWR